MGENDKQTVTVTVACGTASSQTVYEIHLPEGSTVRDAVIASGILATCPGKLPDNVGTGIFGRLVTGDRRLREGDRVEIYRPLALDPKDLRFQRAHRKA